MKRIRNLMIACTLITVIAILAFVFGQTIPLLTNGEFIFILVCTSSNMIVLEGRLKKMKAGE